MAGLLSVLGGAGCGESKTAGEAQHALVGNPAPDFSGTAVNGDKSKVSLSGFKGKVVLVDFWGTYCEPCKKSFPKLQDLKTKYEGQLVVVGVSEDEADSKDEIAPFIETHGAKFLSIWDQDKSIAGRWDPKKMPTSFLVDKKGVVRFAHLGYHDGEDVALEKEIKQLIAE